MRILMIPIAAMAMSVAGTAAAPAMAQGNGHHERGHDDRGDRAYVDRQELRGDRRDIRDERRDYRDAVRDGDRHDIKRERKDLKRAEKEYRQDARDWNRGRYYSYSRPDPRFGGYYADNYYRSGSYYQPLRLRPTDRIYRGRDNRYYCRRSDGTTGLIVGGLTGGVLGNAIAPGGSKTIGTILGGGIGALLGQSIDRNSITCR